MRTWLIAGLAAISFSGAVADSPRVFDDRYPRRDAREDDLITLNGYFPFHPVDDRRGWQQRQDEIKRRILISQGLWPLPPKRDLQAVVHRRHDFDDYTIEAVFFQSAPGHFVTGSLYRPKGKPGPYPVILCPHGHWTDARFFDAGKDAARQSIAEGAERFESGARNPIQARCVQLARMGCIALLIDMTGYSDSVQLPHRHDESSLTDKDERWGFFSVRADLRLQNMMGLQTWNCIRSIDFLLQLPDADPSRVGVTGASGGGTQSMIVAAIDPRVTAAMPCVMVSTSMQGGCSCENAPYLRIAQGNVDIAAAIAPRPLGLTAADDWTVELRTKGFPALQRLYKMLRAEDRLTAAFNVQFKHNYNHVNRVVMYGFFNRHFRLGFDEPVLERDFQRMEKEQLTVWNGDHPAPTGQQVGDAHEIELLRQSTSDAEEGIRSLIPGEKDQLAAYRAVVGKAWETILGRKLSHVGRVTFTETSLVRQNDVDVQLGFLEHHDAEEQIPAMVMQTSTDTKNGVVVWVSTQGKSQLLEDQDAAQAAGWLTNQGYTVVTADLSAQGELATSRDVGPPGQTQRMWFQRKGTKTWERYCGFTYGYNHPLFVRRTHDSLSLIKYAKSLAGGLPLVLVGQGSDGGAIAIAAYSQAGDAVGQAIVDAGDFRFAAARSHDAASFLPGSVKYLDLDGLLSTCAPHPVSVTGMTDSDIAARTYASAGALQSLRRDDHRSMLDMLKASLSQ